jgi:hypothetical protein
MCCIHVFYFVKWSDGVKETGSVICVSWGIYSTVCKLELEFPWKSNVVLDLCGSEDFEKRG